MNNSPKVMMAGSGFLRTALAMALTAGASIGSAFSSGGIRLPRSTPSRAHAHLTRNRRHGLEARKIELSGQRKRHRTVKAETTYGRLIRASLNDQAMTRNQKKKFYSNRWY